MFFVIHIVANRLPWIALLNLFWRKVFELWHSDAESWSFFVHLYALRICHCIVTPSTCLLNVMVRVSQLKKNCFNAAYLTQKPKARKLFVEAFLRSSFSHMAPSCCQIWMGASYSSQATLLHEASLPREYRTSSGTTEETLFGSQFMLLRGPHILILKIIIDCIK